MYLCSTDAAIHRASAKIYTGGGGGKGVIQTVIHPPQQVQ